MAKRCIFNMDQQEVIRNAVHEGWVGACLTLQGIKIFKHRLYDPRTKEMEPEISRVVMKDGTDEFGFLYDLVDKGGKSLSLIYFMDKLPTYMEVYKDKPSI